MKNYNHYQYCEALARSLKAISHTDHKCQYFEATEQTELEELEQNISNVSGTILIAIDGQVSSYTFNNDNLIEKPYYSILIARQTKSTDARTITQSQQFCKQLAAQVIAKMLNDACTYKDGCDRIDPNSFTVEGFGPIADLFYGVILSFTMDVGINYELKPDYWI